MILDNGRSSPEMSERMQAEHERFMAAALQEAQKARDLGNAACGAVIVRDGEVLSTGYNEVTSTCDIAAHAEAAAIRKLTTTRRQLNSGSQADSGPFAGAVLYSTLERLDTRDRRSTCGAGHFLRRLHG
jgi:tRNA(Arg) A34 adenosine deaminase TadA